MARHSMWTPEVKSRCIVAEVEQTDAEQLLADPSLHIVRQDEGRRWHPKVAHAIDTEVEILVRMTGYHQPER